jgi:sugar lactone lactonase YvrE
MIKCSQSQELSTYSLAINSVSAFFLLVLLVSSAFCPAQTVITLSVKGLNGPNGFAIDSTGTLYVANEPGKKVVKIVHDSIAEDVLTSDSPDGLDFDNDNNLFVTNFYSGIILRKRNNATDTFVTGLHTPADIKWDGKEYLYVSEYETGEIKKINRQKEVTTFASGFKNPFGLIFDNQGYLYVANNSGVINKINKEGQVSFFVEIPGVISYLAYDKRSENFYVACFSCNNIYVITNKGETKTFSGQGIAGYRDGPLNEAEFQQPNSIIVSKEGNIYVSEFSANRIRKIITAEK